MPSAYSPRYPSTHIDPEQKEGVADVTGEGWVLSARDNTSLH